MQKRTPAERARHASLAAARKRRLERLRRLAAELRQHGWDVNEPAEPLAKAPA